MTVAQELTRMPMDRAMRIMEAPGTPFPFGRKVKKPAKNKSTSFQKKHTLAQEQKKRMDALSSMPVGEWIHHTDLPIDFSDSYKNRMLRDLLAMKKVMVKKVSKTKYYMRPAE